MHFISPHAFRALLRSGSKDPEADYINVCTTAEYREKHIDGVRSVPLDELTHHKDEFAGKKRIYVHCRSGKRAEKAIGLLQEMGIDAELFNVQGGLLAWEEAGFPTRASGTTLPLMRQVMLAAGSLILLGIVLHFVLHPSWIFLSGFVGAGLFVAGATGWCGMALLLSKMPWNK